MRSFLLALAAIVCSGPACRADLIVGYTVANNAHPVSPETAVGVTGIDLSRGSGLTATSGTEGFQASHWTVHDDDYIEFGFSDSTKPIDLTQLRFATNRTDEGPTSMVVSVSIDDAAFVDIGAFSVDNFFSNQSLNLNYSQVNSAVFRFYAFGARSLGGALIIPETGNYIGVHDLVVEGVFSAVPEASAFLFGGLAVAGTAVCRLAAAWRRKRAAEPVSDR